MLTVLLLMSCDNAPPENMDESSVPVELSASAPERVSLGETYDIQPDITMDESGVLWTAWVGYMTENKDRIYVTSQEDSGWTEPEIVTPTGGNYVRPIIVNVGKEMVVLWTATDEETAIWESRTSEGGWSAPKQITPPGHHFNPEACVDDQGRLWMVWQGHGLIDYDIFLAFYDGGQWSEPISVSQHPGNEWDPSITCDSNGRLWIAWSRFQDADYDLYLVSYEGEQFSEERRLTDHGAYDLHPWLTVDEQDRLWVAWDRIAIPEHGSSGEAVLQDGKLVNRSIGWGQPKWKKGKWYNPVSQADVGVLCLQSDSLFVPRATLPFIPPGYQIKHCAYPKIEADAAGRVWLAFRAWMFKLTNPHMYWWDVAVLCYSGDTWSKPEIIPRSDGYLEEPSVTVGKDSVWVAAQMEHRRTARPDHPHPEQGPLAFEFDHHWDTMPQGSSGEVYVTRYEVNLATDKPRLNPAPPLSQEPSSLSERWVSRDSTRYEIDYQGDKYQLLFGDTHKHSNISRCSGGTEPSLDDRYRYSQDVCQHDFFVVSDHSNNTNDFNWWTIQKTADLYYIPGFFVTLFGYELSNTFPTGHKNVIFPQRPAPILRIELDKNSTGPEIWQSLKGKKAITIPHTTALFSGTDWSEHDPEFERLVEIFQPARGSSEHEGAPRLHPGANNKHGFVHEALDKGYKLGFIASTDHGFGAAYAVVYARSASREDVFEALYSRRCYASTARGIVLDFRANGHLMGEEIESDSAAALSIMVRGHAPIAQVDLFADQVVVKKWGADELGEKQCSLSWTDPSLRPGTRTYYVRIMLQDNEMAWSSPIWVNYGADLKNRYDTSPEKSK